MEDLCFAAVRIVSYHFFICCQIKYVYEMSMLTDICTRVSDSPNARVDHKYLLLYGCILNTSVFGLALCRCLYIIMSVIIGI